MAAYSLSPEARADLRSITHYTIEVWSAAQARKYVAGLRARCMEFAQSPMIAPGADDVDEGLRRFRHESHVIYFRVVPHGIHVAAILHVRQDPALRFDNDA